MFSLTNFILDAGPFGLLVVIMGAIGVCVSVAQLATGRNLQGATTWCAAVALLIGVVGTGLGLLTAANAVVDLATPEEAYKAARLWRQAQAIAFSTTTLGAMAALVDLGAMALVTLIRPPRDA